VEALPFGVPGTYYRIYIKSVKRLPILSPSMNVK
jgi:hypothetical protein